MDLGGAATLGPDDGDACRREHRRRDFASRHALDFYSGTVLADMTGPAALEKLGPGTVVLAGHNTYQGGTNASTARSSPSTTTACPARRPAPGTVIVQPTLYWSGSGDWTTGQWQLADGTPTPWIDGSSVVLAAGSVINISGPVNVSAITMAGDATISGGTLSLPSWGGTINVLAGTATIDSTIAGSGGLAETGTGTLVLDGTLAYTGTTTVAGGTLDLMSPLAAAPVIAGGQAIGPGAVFSSDGQSLYDIDPAMFDLVQSLFVDQAIDRTDMIQILQSAVVDGAVTADCARRPGNPDHAAERGPAEHARLRGGLGRRCRPGQSGQRQLPGPALGNLADQASRPVAGHGLGGPGGQMVLRHGPAGHCREASTYSVVAGSLFGDNPNRPSTCRVLRTWNRVPWAIVT